MTKANKEKLRQLDIDSTVRPVASGMHHKTVSNGRGVSKGERDLLKELQNLQKYCQKIEQKYEKTLSELRQLK